MYSDALVVSVKIPTKVHIRPRVPKAPGKEIPIHLFKQHINLDFGIEVLSNEPSPCVEEDHAVVGKVCEEIPLVTISGFEIKHGQPKHLAGVHVDWWGRVGVNQGP